MDNIVEVDQLVKKYGSFTAVDHLCFSVEEGKIYGFLGPNGAGKSTTLSIIATLLRYDGGKVLVGGLDCKKNKAEIRKQIGWVPQEIILYPKLSIADNIHFYGALYGLGGKKLSEACKKALKIVSLEDNTRRKVSELSGGMQRRLNIACGIVHDPKLIIMDEPTVGVDAQSRDVIMESIKALNYEGASVIYTSHYLHEVERLCEKIGIINKGKMVADGTYEELSKKLSSGNTYQIETSKEALLREKEKLQKHFSKMGISFGDNCIKVYSDHNGDVNNVLQELISLNIPINQVASAQMSLEDIFLRLTDDKATSIEREH